MTGNLDMGGNSITNVSTTSILFTDGSHAVKSSGDTMTGDLTVNADMTVTGNVTVGGVVTGDGSGLSNLVVYLHHVSNIVWVAENGSSNGLGTIHRPMATPQQGYDMAAARFTRGAVVIAGGSYATSTGLTMHAANIDVFGLANPEIPSLLYTASPSAGFTRIENVVFTDRCSIEGDRLKCHHVRFEQGCETMAANRLVFQDCRFYNDSYTGALQLRTGEKFSINNCSLESESTPTLIIMNMVEEVEVIDCQIVSVSAPFAIRDNQMSPLSPQHLYAHNVIKAPATAISANASKAIAFFHNICQGDLASHMGVVSNYYGNNAVMGTIQWAQADLTAASDPYNDTLFEGFSLPDSWDD